MSRRDHEILAEIDPQSPTFKAIMELASDRHVVAMTRLKTRNMPGEQTEGIRGELSELDWLLGLGERHRKQPAQNAQGRSPDYKI